MGIPEADVRVDISASVDRVWELVSDITLMPGFSTELEYVEWAQGFDGPTLGAQFLGRNRHPAIGEWTTRSHIVAFDPPRVFGWAVGDPGNPAAIWRFELTPTADGTRLVYTAGIGPGRSGVSMMIERDPDRAEQIIRSRLRQFTTGMAATIAGIKELAENGAT